MLVACFSFKKRNVQIVPCSSIKNLIEKPIFLNPLCLSLSEHPSVQSLKGIMTIKLAQSPSLFFISSPWLVVMQVSFQALEKSLTWKCSETLVAGTDQWGNRTAIPALCWWPCSGAVPLAHLPLSSPLGPWCVSKLYLLFFKY